MDRLLEHRETFRYTTGEITLDAVHAAEPVPHEFLGAAWVNDRG